jgi:hypothetical protein
MPPAAWSALFTGIGLIWAFTAQTIEWRRNRFVRGIDAITGLDRRFDSPEFRKTRREAATFLLRTSSDDDSEDGALFDVLDFFETVGYLWRKKLIDTETAWHFFASWLLPYVAASESIIAHSRKDDPSLFRELDKMFIEVKYFERTQHPSHEADHLLSRDSIADFLRSEAALSQASRRA